MDRARRVEPRLDLGAGESVRAEIFAPAGYRDSPTPACILVGDAAPAVAIVRRCLRRYRELSVTLWFVWLALTIIVGLPLVSMVSFFRGWE